MQNKKEQFDVISNYSLNPKHVSLCRFSLNCRAMLFICLFMCLFTMEGCQFGFYFGVCMYFTKNSLSAKHFLNIL